MNTIFKLAIFVSAAIGMFAQTPTLIPVSRVQNAAQLGADGKVLASQLPAGSGGGSGASQTAQLLDWKFTLVSPTQLRFGDPCLPGSPCNVDIGGTVSQLTNGPYYINLLGTASGSICVYIANPGQITVGIGSGLTTSNITGSSSLIFTGGVDSCPQDASKLAKWDVTNGAFVSTGFQYASYLSYKPSPVAGTGIQIVAGVRDSVQIDTGSVMRKFTCAGGPGTTLPSGAALGDICFDFNPTTPAKYVCANTGGCTTAADWKGF